MVPFTEQHNNVVYFDATAPNAAALSPSGQPLAGAANKLGLSGYDRAVIAWKHVDPRLGFAYSINSKTVLSAGFSINHLNGGPYDFGNNKISLQYGTLLNGIVNVNSHGSNVPGVGQWDLNPLSLPGNTPFSPTEFNGNGALHAFSRNPGEYPYGEYWNIGIQRELPYNMLFAIAYVAIEVCIYRRWSTHQPDQPALPFAVLRQRQPQRPKLRHVARLAQLCLDQQTRTV